MPVYLTDDAEAETDRLAGIHTYLPAEEIAASPKMLIGSEDEVADQIAERARSLGITYSVLRGAPPEAFAPIIRRLRSPA